ncbi:XRE family transcriptional regulator [Microbacterium sp. KUDC0406]|uniref:XRE family transcriptional regulator n=1 Tax=Microbacterium sp. KUDC0406 TaxID=2909588 RepID=UPI001F351686|nr:XRE family transcriptional regulator [Microbacterium sp. KUDC0406]UJP09989.1 XRE family transcriptional regulator [Microbacterium sp. KUDC0406]
MRDLRAMRLAAGLTQAELAQRVGTARPNIAAYESGAKTPSPELRERLERAMRPRPSQALAGREAEVTEIAARYGAVRVRVFGSAAKGRDTPESDLDLLVDLAPRTSFYAVSAMEDELAALLDVEVEVVSARTATDEMTGSAIDLPMPQRVA